MSNIIIRNVSGTGPFSIPSGLTQLQSMDAEIASILSGIPNLYYLSARGQVLENPGFPQELIIIVESIMYFGSVVVNTTALRTAVNSAFTANPNITSIGTIEIRIVPEGAYYNKYPQIEYVDSVNAIVQFVNDIPPGAQIEVYKYSFRRTGDHWVPTPPPGHYADPRKGKRYRPDRMMAKGSLTLNLSNAIRQVKRNHFRFAFRWPPPNSPIGPGIRGPLGPIALSTTTPRERTQNGVLLIYEPSPSRMPAGGH